MNPTTKVMKSRAALGIVTVTKRSLVLTGSMFCRITISTRAATAAIAINLAFRIMISLSHTRNCLSTGTEATVYPYASLHITTCVGEAEVNGDPSKSPSLASTEKPLCTSNASSSWGKKIRMLSSATSSPSASPIL